MDSLEIAKSTFALNLFNKLNEKDPTKNVFFSPLSISSALAMLLLGADGNTEAQILNVLSVTKGKEVHQGYQKLISEINRTGTKYLLKLANRLFGEALFEFLPPFIESSQKFYHAGLEKLNFLGASEDARKHMNTWVEEQTAGKIQNLLAPGTVNNLTRLVLVNATYFKSNWAYQFQKGTEERQFKVTKNESKPVQLMYRKAKYNMTYIGDYRTNILEVPYIDNELSMIIMLPDKIEDNSTGLEKLERELTEEKLLEWTKPDMMNETEIILCLPIFKLEETYDLKPVLRSMGMTEPFDPLKANFSGMSPSKDLVLSEFVHKSFIEVNEKGTEAAAVTATPLVPRYAKILPEFIADHPFLFFIRHNKTCSILFYGRFCSP